MKKFYVTLILALVCTMASFAQGHNLVEGKELKLDIREVVANRLFNATNSKKILAAKAESVDLVSPPESATVETDWLISGSYYNNGNAYSNSNAISVAFDGNDVYIQGLSFLCPNGWIKGTIDGTTVTFPNGQYVGDYGSNSIYACGANDGGALTDLTFTYYESLNLLILNNIYIENTSTTELSYFFFSNDIVVQEDGVIPTPANVEAEPAVTSAAISWEETSAATGWNLRYREIKEIDPSLMTTWDFEDSSLLSDWSVIDNDGDGNGWAYYNVDNKAYSGSYAFLSASYDNTSGALTPDNWLITPKVTLGGKVSFFACGFDPNYAAEVFAVYVCVGEPSSIEDFVMVSDGDITATGTMTKYEFDLSSYEGEGYVAIRHYNCSDMFYLEVDDVTVVLPGGESEAAWINVAGLDSENYTIEGLEPETNYEVQVQSILFGVTSEWTESTLFTTLAPTDITVTVPAAATDGEFNYATLFYSDKNLVIPEGIGAYTATVANGNVTLEEVKEIIPAGTAVVLKTASKLSEATDFSFAVTNETGASAENNMLRGSDEDATINAEGYKYYMLSLNGASEENSIGFYWDKNSNSGTQLNTKAHKAYLAVPQEAAQAKGYPFGNDATGINGVSVSADEKAGEVFDLQGRRVARPVKGIYIVNGKKIVIK